MSLLLCNKIIKNKLLFYKPTQVSFFQILLMIWWMWSIPVSHNQTQTSQREYPSVQLSVGYWISLLMSVVYLEHPWMIRDLQHTVCVENILLSVSYENVSSARRTFSNHSYFIKITTNVYLFYSTTCLPQIIDRWMHSFSCYRKFNILYRFCGSTIKLIWI